MSSNALPDITATPAADQHILHNRKEYTTVKEGLAHILIPASAPKIPQTTPGGDNQPQSVFYNPIQQFNRDLSVLAIKAYGEEALERKRKSLEKSQQKSAEKKNSKKRKRGEDGLSKDTSRKAGKVEATNTVQVTEVNEVVSEEPTVPQGDQAQSVEDGTITQSVEEHKGVGDPGTKQESPSIASANPDTSMVDCERQIEASVEAQRQAEEQVSGSTIKPFVPTFTILDALSATGLRALRYAHEIPFTTSVTANDLLATATDTIKLNAKHNRLEDKIQAVTGNALTHMYSLVGDECRDDKGRPKPCGKYDVIDLDPYGTAAPFLDAAVQSVRDDGGLLCVTCTDAGVWASNGYPEKSYSLYGGVPIKGIHSHEGGLRLILHAIATSAARYGLAVEPLLSLSIDFYARVFVRIHKSAADVKFLAGKTMVVYNCDTGCGAWTTQMLAKNKLAPNKNGTGYFWKHVFGPAPSASENCAHCGMKTHMAGPMYAGPLHSPEFIKRILDGLPKVSKETYQTTDRIEGMLTLALDESLPLLEEDTNSPTLPSKTRRYDPATLDHYPFFIIPSVLSKVIHCITPHENALRGALRHLGYRVTRSHTKPGSIKTDAPWEVIWEVMREWVSQKAPAKEGAVRKGTAGYVIMSLDEKAKPENGLASSDGVKKEHMKKDTPEDKVKLEVVFDEALGKERDGKKLIRYQLNPRENWGPMNRAKGHA
jgi:tRNA (guanine26-N2/guanine27-N2)-dimethyltransferase